MRRANNLPFNRSQKLSSNHELHFESESRSVHLGSVKFVGSSRVPDASVILVDGETVFWIRFEDDGFISIDLTIRDANNRLRLTIRRGELRHSIESWDVTFEGTTLTMRRGPSDVVLRIGKACRDGDGAEIANNESGLHRLFFESFGSMLGIGDYLGLEGAAISLPLARRWFGGFPAMPGSFS